MKGAEGRGHRTPDGFVVFKGSTAVLQERQAAHKWPATLAIRKQLIADSTLVQKDGYYEFTKDVEFSSPSPQTSIVIFEIPCVSTKNSKSFGVLRCLIVVHPLNNGIHGGISSETKYDGSQS